MRRRLLLAVLGALGIAVAIPALAAAHPLGNFTMNHLVEVRISQERIELHYILDQAEIPTFQERDRSAAERISRVEAELMDRLRVTDDGRGLPLTVETGTTLDLLPGQGGLQTTRIEVDLSAPFDGTGTVAVRDGTYEDRLGWKAVIAKAGDGTDVRSTVPSEDITDGLRRYPDAGIERPSDVRSATFTVREGDGALTAPAAKGGGDTRTRSDSQTSGDGFAGVFADAAAGEGILLLLLLTAFGWGALHALSPGHGKGMVAAYLVGSRGTTRDALALGMVVTITHTIGVFALGLVTLLLAQYILPEDLYPWLNVAAGALVVGIGGAILWSRLQTARGKRAPLFSRLIDHDHEHGPDHTHGSHHHHDHPAHDHSEHDEAHSQSAHGHGHSHDHDHHPPRDITWKGILGMGASAGLIPCPSALVVLLGAISQQQVALGLLLIVTFSIGLAATLSILGIAVVHAGRLTSRLNVPGRVTRALPVVSAVIIVGLGLVLTGRALPEVL